MISISVLSKTCILRLGIISSSERPRPAIESIDIDTLVTLYSAFFVDEAELRDNIRRMLMSRVEVTLGDVIKNYPITQGVSEIVNYLLIAIQTSEHCVDRLDFEIITLKMVNGGDQTLRIPLMNCWRGRIIPINNLKSRCLIAIIFTCKAQKMPL